VIRNTLLVLIPMIGEVAVLVLAMRRGMWRRRPFFCGYVAWVILSDLALLLAEWRFSADEYFRLYDIEFPIDWVVRFLFLTEIVLAVWKRQQTTRSRRMEFVLVMMLFAGMFTLWPVAHGSSASAESPKFVLYKSLLAVLSLLFVVCWLVLEGLQRHLSLSRMDCDLPIMRGLGVNAVLNLLEEVVFRTLSSEWDSGVVLLQTGSHVAVLIYWICCLSRSMPTPLADV